MKLLVFIFFISLKIPAGQCQTIIYSCHDSKIISKDTFNLFTPFETWLNNSKDNKTDNKETDCSGDCNNAVQENSGLMTLNCSLLKQVFTEKLKNYTAGGNAPIALNNEGLLKLREEKTLIESCSSVEKKLQISDYVNQKNLLIAYPYNTNYMFITGRKKIDSDLNNFIQIDKIESVIEESIIMGTDPYVTIALSLMEGGNGSVGNLYLDPIGVMRALGCSLTQVDNGSNHKVALNSFGTSYIVQSEVKKIPELQKKLTSFFQTFNIPSEKGTSYYCYNVKGEDEKPLVFEKPKSNSCCIELGFKATTSNPLDSDKITHALTYEYIDQIIKNPYQQKSDPAWKLQRFNGYTDLMGGAESVPPWRSGLNFYKTPTYGYQTMDYIINGLMFNPYIEAKINELQKKHNLVPDSILCKGKKNGIYAIDQDFYFEVHKSAPRFKGIYKKFLQGLKYSQLSAREKKVLLYEMQESSLQNSHVPDTLPLYQENKLRNELNQQLYNACANSNKSDCTIELLKFNTLSLDEWKKKIFGKHGFNLNELNAIYSLDSSSKKFDNNSTKIRKEYDEIEKKYPCTENYESCANMKNKVAEYMFNADATKPTITDSEILKLLNEIEIIRSEYQQIHKNYYAVQKNFVKNFGYLATEEVNLSYVMSQIDLPESFENAIERLQTIITLPPDFEKNLKIYHQSLTSKNDLFDKEKAYREYFTKIYPNRNTVQKASTYPWRKFNEEEIKIIMKAFKS